jgi:hypothetical protein
MRRATQRGVLRCLASSLIVGACAAGTLPPSAKPAPSSSSTSPHRRPNAFLIVTDDQRAMGTLQAMPPTRRRFVRGGTRYRNAFTTTPVCCPSRASIMTGRYAHNTGVKTNAAGHLLAHATTIQRYLHDAGYRTGIFGKYLQGMNLATDPPYFDKWATFLELQELLRRHVERHGERAPGPSLRHSVHLKKSRALYPNIGERGSASVVPVSRSSSTSPPLRGGSKVSVISGRPLRRKSRGGREGSIR